MSVDVDGIAQWDDVMRVAERMPSSQGAITVDLQGSSGHNGELQWTAEVLVVAPAANWRLSRSLSATGGNGRQLF